ncbi:MAG: DinB family protein [Gemmatimonadaceae bacterium]
MTERMAAALAAAESARADLIAVVSPLDEAALTRRQSPAWTPLEVLEHLRLSEENIVRLLAHRLMRAREQGLTPGAPAPELDKDSVFLADVSADSPEILIPQAGLSRDGVLAGLSKTRDALRALCTEVDAFDGTKVVARHIVLGEIHFYRWIHFIGAHEARHRRQIGRILGSA